MFHSTFSKIDTKNFSYFASYNITSLIVNLIANFRNIAFLQFVYELHYYDVINTINVIS